MDPEQLIRASRQLIEEARDSSAYTLLARSRWWEGMASSRALLAREEKPLFGVGRTEPFDDVPDPNPIRRTPATPTRSRA